MDIDTKLPRPPYDPELEAILTEMAFPPKFTIEMMTEMRANDPIASPIEEQLAAHPRISHTEHTIPGPNSSDSTLTLSVFTPKNPAPPGTRPCLYYIHGGGTVMGTRFSQISLLLDVVEECGATGTSIEYRLAPEHPYPAGLEDCYAGLLWVFAHAAELGVDEKRVVVAGQSGGALLAAGMALLCRDRKGPRPVAQFLGCPMLDDRNGSVSSRQFVGEGSWSRGSNGVAWDAYLDGKAGTEGVSVYAAPGRAVDLARLPAAFIDVGSMDVLRDEAVAYASKLWACGTQAELHIWPGGWHGFDVLAPTASLSRCARKAQMDWIKRVFGGGVDPVPQPPDP